MSKKSRKTSLELGTVNPELLLDKIAKSLNKEPSDYMFFLNQNGNYYDVLECSK